MNFQYPSFETVVAIHDNMVDLYGGSHGLRDEGLVRSALARPQAAFGGEDLYETLFEKAAALFHSLMFNHAFVDGNKRTTVATTAYFLACNGYELEAGQKELVDFALKVENQHLSLEIIADWLSQHSTKLQ